MTKYNLKWKGRQFGLRLIIFVILLVLLKVLIIGQNSKTYYSDDFLRLLEGPLKYNNPELISYIRDKVLEPPSTLPYNLEIGSHGHFYSSDKFYAFFNEKLFASKRNGFFVEAGANDGQAMSNTLELEMRQGWTGLLVEPDPSNYIGLKRKNRKAWAAKTCLSITGYPKKESLSSLSIKKVSILSGTRGRMMGGIVVEQKNDTFSSRGFNNDPNEIINSYYTRQCFPLESLLLALNVTRVDLLSLDVEHFEKEIIEHFDFDRFDVQVMYMEWWDLERLPWLDEFMYKKGFVFVKNIVGDIIYVKENSEARRIVNEKHLQGDFIVFKGVNDSKYLN